MTGGPVAARWVGGAVAPDERRFSVQGGQILRVSTALSCVLGLPLRVRRIRAGRSQPGLR